MITSDEPGVQAIIAAVGGGFALPAHDEIGFTYYGSTNNVHTQVFKRGGATVAMLTYGYVGSGAADNDRVNSIVRS